MPHHESALQGRPVLVTGASGFIGRHLVRHLLGAGARVHAVSRSPADPDPDVSWVVCDLTDADATRRMLARVAPDVVFHLASRVEGGRSAGLVLPMLEGNTHSAINLMTAASEIGGCRIVLAGSVEEPHTGETPVSPYAAAKASATSYARLFGHQWGLTVTVLRLAMVYGPDQPDTRKLLPHVVTSLVAGEVPRLGSGTRRLDWVFVDDVCEALLRAAGRTDPSTVVADIGSGTGTSIADTVRLVADIVGHDGELGLGETGDRRDERAHVADLDTAAEVLGWRPRTPLAEGLARTVEALRARA